MVLSANPVSKLARVQVMVMDGSTNAADLLREVFFKLGFSNIHIAKDGYEGIQVMKKTPIHLVFTDWELRVRKRRIDLSEGQALPADTELMPLDGADFVKRLRWSPRSPNPFVPVAMVVNENIQDKIAAAREAGVNEILIKPLRVDDLCDRIIKLVDDTRHFITAKSYKGPCRRLEAKPLSEGSEERRKQQVRLVRRRELRGV